MKSTSLSIVARPQPSCLIFAERTPPICQHDNRCSKLTEASAQARCSRMMSSIVLNQRFSSLLFLSHFPTAIISQSTLACHLPQAPSQSVSVSFGWFLSQSFSCRFRASFHNLPMATLVGTYAADNTSCLEPLDRLVHSIARNAELILHLSYCCRRHSRYDLN